MQSNTKRLAMLGGGWLLLLAFIGGLAFLFIQGPGFGTEAPYTPVVALAHSVEGETHTYRAVLSVPGCRNLAASYTTMGGLKPTISVALAMLPETFCPEFETGERTISFGVGAAGTTTPEISAVTLDGRPLQFSVHE